MNAPETNHFYEGDAKTVLQTFPDEFVNTCVTSPPYFNQRDYGVPGQIGVERTLKDYVTRLVDVFREVKRVLLPTGTLWLNLGDGFSRNKQLLGVPWRVAFALQEDGWVLRSDIIWEKPNAFPESVKDRPTRSHEYVFLLAKSRKYDYNADAIKEPISPESLKRLTQKTFDQQKGGEKDYRNGINPNRSARKTVENMKKNQVTKRNKRSVWTVSTKAYQGAHFATFPPKLVEPCILAGSPADGIVLDPFSGSGTTALVARQHQRQFLGIELNSDTIRLAASRLGENQ